jgi:hypothetical protein
MSKLINLIRAKASIEAIKATYTIIDMTKIM